MPAIMVSGPTIPRLLTCVVHGFSMLDAGISGIHPGCDAGSIRFLSECSRMTTECCLAAEGDSRLALFAWIPRHEK